MTQLQKITRKAKQIRRRGEKWTDAIKRASKLVPSLSPSKRSKPARKVGAKKKGPKSRQTGTSNKYRDELIQAKPPGKRRVKTAKGSHVYYERRKNRSDKPGSLTGSGSMSATYRYNILQRISSNIRLQNEGESRLTHLQRKLREASREEKPKIRTMIKEQRKYLATVKKDISGFKSLLK